MYMEIVMARACGWNRRLACLRSMGIVKHECRWQESQTTRAEVRHSPLGQGLAGQHPWGPTHWVKPPQPFEVSGHCCTNDRHNCETTWGLQ